mmetsp:Transcript_35436/g.52723  ORF Transcript_35436/g.52723 Transcript_35436/m.52723 type:complete len:96 (+) Transcript_35436:23-310(+)
MIRQLLFIVGLEDRFGRDRVVWLHNDKTMRATELRMVLMGRDNNTGSLWNEFCIHVSSLLTLRSIRLAGINIQDFIQLVLEMDRLSCSKNGGPAQ